MRISVVTVSYNMRATIEDCVRSVHAQSFRDVEHFVIDGASTDGTVEVLRRIQGTRTSVVSEPDAGIYDAMNKGLRLATGDVVGFLNADDLYVDGRVLARVAETFADDTVDACFADLCYVKQANTSAVVRYWKSASFVPGAFARGWCPAHPTFFVRRSVLARSGGFNERYRIASDVELMMRLLEVERIKSVHIPEVWVRMRVGGVTNRHVGNVLHQNREIIGALRGHRLFRGIIPFVCGKVASRSLQYLRRPNQFS